MKLLKKLYSRLPIVREIHTIRGVVMRMEGLAEKRTRKQLNEYVHSYLLVQPRYQDAKRLNGYEFQTFSQNGEDGIIAEIFRRIGVSSRSFVEIGVGDGLENNTTALLLQGWTGVWVDGNQSSVRAINSEFGSAIRKGQLKVKHAFVTAENIDNLFEQLNIPTEFDLLSLDVDRNTYFLWAKLGRFRPRAVVIEYNSSIPPDVDWKVDYHPELSWNETVYFGASLKAFELLGRELGYRLVGCELHGVNAFFVREDLCSSEFAEPFTAENHYEPPRYWLIRRDGHARGFSDMP